MSQVRPPSQEAITTALSPEQIAQRLAILTGGGAAAAPEAEAPKYRFVRPLSASADTLVDYLQNNEGRVMFGLKEIDVMMRGVGRGELCYVTGFSHSGKTQLFLGMVLNNRERPGVLFTFDEPTELVLTKLVCMRLGWDAEMMEERIKAHDPSIIAQVRKVAQEDFKNLLVIDESLSPAAMTIALEEAEDHFGRPVEYVGIDYLELLPCDESEIDKKSQLLKRWVKDVDMPVICIHQGSRGNAGKGQAITMQSMKYGGESEAIFVVGVRRQRDNEQLDDFDRLQHANTVSISVVKNKRPPARKGEHTFYLDPQCGLIRPMRDDDIGAPKSPATAQSALAARAHHLGAA